MATIEDMVKVTIRIGNGERAHRAWANREVKDAGMPWQRVTFRRLHLACSCPGSQNGFAQGRATIVAEGWEKANCKN